MNSWNYPWVLGHKCPLFCTCGVFWSARTLRDVEISDQVIKKTINPAIGSFFFNLLEVCRRRLQVTGFINMNDEG